MAPFPSKNSIRCGGISMIVAQILFCCAWLLHTSSYPLNDVKSEEDVVALHNELSSDSHRYKTEIAVGCIWVSFPFLLAALYILQSLSFNLFRGSTGEIFVYLMEKSAIIWMIIMYILLPAISLVAISYEWEFYEVVIDKQIPTGYYIQFYTQWVALEIIDCAAIADATFMISIFIAVRCMLYGSTHNVQKFQKFRTIVEPSCFKKCNVLCAEIISCLTMIGLFIIFCIILFEFAESGFFSPSGYAKFLIGIVVFMKIGIGARLIAVSGQDKYERIKNLFHEYDNKNIISSNIAGRDSISPRDINDTQQIR